MSREATKGFNQVVQKGTNNEEQAAQALPDPLKDPKHAEHCKGYMDRRRTNVRAEEERMHTRPDARTMWRYERTDEVLRRDSTDGRNGVA